MHDKLLQYLKDEPRARERANKNRAIGNLILKEYHLDIPKETMTEIVGEILSADRAWRKILEDNLELRGSDYKDKEILAQKAQLALGYQPNYQLIK